MCKRWNCPFHWSDSYCDLPDDENCPYEAEKEEYGPEEYGDDLYHQRVDEEMCHV